MMTQAQTSEIVKKLKDALDPVAIYLFGSQAKGNADQDSDVDVFVVVDENPSVSTNTQTQQAYASLRNTKLAVDVIVNTQKRFWERSSWISSIEHEVTVSGKLIYGKDVRRSKSVA